MFKDIKAEFNKITWVGKKELVKKSRIVIVASIVLGVLISMIDYLTIAGIDKIIPFFGG